MFDSTSYIHFTESPSFTLNDLNGCIGGTVGLLLGMSVLSIFEFLDILFELVLTWYEKKKERKVVVSANF
jgi:hypothetical protein